MKILDSAAAATKNLPPDFLSQFSDQIFLVKAGAPIPAQARAAQCIALGQELSATQLIDILVVFGIRHVIQSTKTNFEREIKIAATILTSPESFMKDPASTVFTGSSPQGQLSVIFNNSNDKPLGLQKVINYLEQIPGAKTVKDSILLAFNEMLTNGLYNAPTDESGKSLFNNYDRNVPVTLPKGTFIKISLAHDKERLFMSCEDPFGSFSEKRLLERFLQSQQGEKIGSLNMGPGGAGIGCRLMLEKASEFFALSKTLKQTLVGCCFPLGLSSRAAEKLSKNIHIAMS